MMVSKQFGVNIARHIIIAVNVGNNIPTVIPIARPICQVPLTNIEPVNDFKFFHITNFHKPKEDLMLIGNEVLIRVYSLGGETQYEYQLREKDKLKAISSDPLRNFFLVVNRDSTLAVLKFNRRIENDKVETFITFNLRTFVSISVSKSVVAVLVNDTENSFWLHLKSNSKNGAQTVYNCLAPSNDLRGVIVLEERKQEDLSYCQDHKQKCKDLGTSEACNFEVKCTAKISFTIK